MLHSLDDTETLLKWPEIQALFSSGYAYRTGHPPIIDLVSKFVTWLIDINY
jgi:hypothetical protein